jgi:hypothetical protein
MAFLHISLILGGHLIVNQYYVDRVYFFAVVAGKICIFFLSAAGRRQKKDTPRRFAHAVILFPI